MCGLLYSKFIKPARLADTVGTTGAHLLHTLTGIQKRGGVWLAAQDTGVGTGGQPASLLFAWLLADSTDTGKCSLRFLLVATRVEGHWFTLLMILVQDIVDDDARRLALALFPKRLKDALVYDP